MKAQTILELTHISPLICDFHFGRKSTSHQLRDIVYPIFLSLPELILFYRFVYFGCCWNDIREYHYHKYPKVYMSGQCWTLQYLQQLSIAKNQEYRMDSLSDNGAYHK